MSRVALAWWRNINFIPIVPKRAYDVENETGGEAALIVSLLLLRRSVVRLSSAPLDSIPGEIVRLRGCCGSEREETALRRGDSAEV